MKNKKIIWAVDVLEDSKSQNHPLSLLKTLIGSLSAEVLPAYVLSPPPPYFGAESKNLEEAFRALAEKRLLELSKNSKIAKMSSGSVLVCPHDSMKMKARCLTDFALSKEADLIVVATHSRKGVSRLFLGSFAETLALESKIPVVTVNPQNRIPDRISKMLFPTTFQSKYHPAFEKVVEMAKTLNASLTLFYKEPLIPAPYMSIEIYEFIERESVQRKRDAAKWQEWSENRGVKTNIFIDDDPGYIPPCIEKFASGQNIDLITMVSQNTAFSSIVLGSFTRQVIREAPCPVWSVHIGEGSSDQAFEETKD